MTTANGNTLADKVAALLAEKKMVMLDTLAQACGVSELQAAEALPQHMRAFAAAADFDAIWADLTAWESATFIMRHSGSVVEIKGQIPAGKHGAAISTLIMAALWAGTFAATTLPAWLFCPCPSWGWKVTASSFLMQRARLCFPST